LKASQGHKDWLNFFKLSSIGFSDIENRLLHKNSNTPERKELIQYINKLGVLSRLRAFVVSTEHIDKEKGSKVAYYLLTLEIDKSNINVRRYSSGSIAKASKDYAEREKEFKNNTDKDVVLISASSVHGLKKAYPNYFADTTEFSKYLERIIEANKTS